MEQKEAIQTGICGDVSSNVQMFFGRSINILSLLQVVKRVELGIEEILWQEKSIPHFSLDLPFPKITNKKAQAIILNLATSCPFLTSCLSQDGL